VSVDEHRRFDRRVVLSPSAPVDSAIRVGADRGCATLSMLQSIAGWM
jgi:hypothetical protein